MPVLKNDIPSYKRFVILLKLRLAISPQKRIASLMRYKNRFQSASLTTEAALVFPIFFFALYLFWQCFLLVLFQMNVCWKVSEAAMNYAHLGYPQRNTEEEITDMSWLYLPLLWNAVPKNEKVKQVLVFCTSKDDGAIEVNISYRFLCEAVFFTTMEFPVQQTFRFYPYLGETDPDLLAEKSTDKTEQTEPSKDIVYMTEHGSVYHESKACVYLTVTVHKVAVQNIGKERNSSGEIYQECSKCRKAEKGAWVYISSGGNRYHWSLNCTAIKKNIIEKTREEVAGVPICHKCAEQKQ